MRALVLAAVLVCCSAAIQKAPLKLADSASQVPGEYVVVFEDNVTDEQVSSHIGTVRNFTIYHGNRTNKILGEYHIGSFRGYGAKMDDILVDLVRLMSHVAYMEYSQFVQHTGSDQPLKITDIKKCGIEIEHPDFGGRAIWGEDFVDNPSPKRDLHGHGTHVAGTVMSNTYGLAKKATSIAVRVLNEYGYGTTTGVIDGINWVAGQHKPGKKSIANMSLGGGRSTALNSAVNAAVGAGVSFAVAAGNDGSNACNYSPASSTLAVTVGASDNFDAFASFSNYGSCMDIIGPGVNITSTWINGGSTTISGTSMASPHVAGVMAKYLSQVNMSPAALKTMIIAKATQDKISGYPGSSSENVLVFKNCPSFHSWQIIPRQNQFLFGR